MGNTRTQAVARGLQVSLAMSISIAALKVAYGSKTGSLAFVADGIHSTLDSLSTLLALLSFRWSVQPPDREHPYGHRKFETLAVLGLALLLSFAAVEVAMMAWDRLRGLDMALPPTNRWIGFVVLGYALLGNFFVARWQKKNAERHGSALLSADAAHNAADFCVTGAVVLSLALAPLNIRWFDPAVSLSISAYLALLAYRFVRQAIRPLVDHSVLDAEDVRRVVLETADVLHAHHIRSRGAPDCHFLDLNIHLPPTMTVERAHTVAHEVERRLKEKFPGLVDVVVHAEPEGHAPCNPPSK